MHKMVGVPEYMVGFANYKGQTIPVVDLSKLLSGKKSQSRLSTRIVLIDYWHEEKHETLGFIAENATEVVKFSEDDFTPNVIASESAPYLGAIANDAEGMLQKIDITGLIDFKVRDHLDWQAA
jgi:chemotaxis-related protein WspB